MKFPTIRDSSTLVRQYLLPVRVQEAIVPNLRETTLRLVKMEIKTLTVRMVALRLVQSEAKFFS